MAVNGVPVLYNINRNSKDATKEFKITYSWDGNNAQQIGNIIYIYDNETNNVVYTEQFDNYYKQECIVPPNSLTNGKLYKVSIAVITNVGISKQSEPMLFYCYTTPTFEFSNLEQEQIIQNDTYKFELSYKQPEGEELEEFYVTLYASDQSVIYTSEPNYNTENLTITISGLNNNTQYYIKGFGQTLTGMSIETESIHITVRYLQPAIYNLVELSNNFHGGYITIKSNIVSLRGRVYNKDGIEIDATYIKNEYVDITNSEHTLKFSENYNLNNNFTLMLKGFGFKRNVPILTLTNGIYKLYVYYRYGNYDSVNNTAKAYFELRVEGEITYTITSNYIEVPTEVDLVGFMLTKKENYYEIVAHNYNTSVYTLPNIKIIDNRIYINNDSEYSMKKNNNNLSIIETNDFNFKREGNKLSYQLNRKESDGAV